MNNAVQTGEIQKVVENGKMLEIASAQLREAETTIAHMDPIAALTLRCAVKVVERKRSLRFSFSTDRKKF